MTFDGAQAYEMLYTHFQDRIKVQEPMALHSSFGVGGPADLYIVLQTREELKELVSICTRERWPLLIVGAGSNILFADAGVRGIVASIVLTQYRIEDQHDGTALIIAEAGVHWSQLVPDLVARGWGGLEFAAGIPGTVGAGAVSNVGAHKQELEQVLEWIDVLDARGCNNIEEDSVFPVLVESRSPVESLDLRYRHSRFRENRLTHIDEHGQIIRPPRGLIEPAELIVALGMRLQQWKPEAGDQMLKQQQQQRKSDDPASRHMGSIFKDPPEATVRALIEQVGLAGLVHGQAQIAKRNANYILNLGDAKAADILALIIQAHQKVLADTGIHLALNVELLGEWQPV